MNINIKGTHIELTDAISDYVHDKLEAVKKVLSDAKEAYIYVEVGKESNHHNKGDIFKAEVEVRSNGTSHYAVVMKDDLYAAIDEVKDEIVEKIKSVRSKERSRFRRGALEVKNFIKGLWRNNNDE